MNKITGSAYQFFAVTDECCVFGEMLVPNSFIEWQAIAGHVVSFTEGVKVEKEKIVYLK